MKRREELFSLRMHASIGEEHLCGAERIVAREVIPQVLAKMAERALLHKGGEPTSIVFGADRLKRSSIRKIPLLPVRTLKHQGPREAAMNVSGLLRKCGVSHEAVSQAFYELTRGAAPSGGNMRGAMLMHAGNGRRLEPDRERGVRVTRMDLTEKARDDLERLLRNLKIYHPRVMEASVLASKVAAAPGIVAELCCSDDPDYTTGYVASRSVGYVRLTRIKEKGETFGGRVFFVEDSASIKAIVTELESVPCLITEVPGV
ncbi:MAG: 6-carboxyhexanoate--CoA ligase [Deltaproteobacteria bacterium]|nr:6-carboxyhexanoate--CoA ligase [Deltaproteobacteria bacterium]